MHENNNTDTLANSAAPTPIEVDASLVRRALGKRSFATLATVSPAGVPHVAGVLYAIHEGSLYISTMEGSLKARNISGSGRAAVCVPVRRLPVGPPSSIQFQGRATVLPLDADELLAAVEAGALGSVTAHGELELDGGCFIRVDVPDRIVTYGLGMSLPALVRDPLSAGGVALLGE